MRNFQIIGTFFALWATIQFSQGAEDSFAYILIFTFGLLHGSNDIKLIQATTARDKSTFRIIYYYVLFTLMVALFFYFIPSLTLILFVFLSAYHFGEEHWNTFSSENSFFRSLFYFVYGMMIFGLLFYCNIESTVLIIETLTGITVTGSVFLWIFLGSGLLTLLGFRMKNFKNFTYSDLLKEIFYVAIFALVFNLATLLWSFAIYFVIWHSLPSLRNQILFLFGNTSKKNIVRYTKSSLIYWTFSLLGILVLYLLFKDSEDIFRAVIFAFIAAITFPHVWVMIQVKDS